MKTILPYALILGFIATSVGSNAQETCTVKVKNLQGQYEGECRKGYANGKGSAKGIDTYEGGFKSGYPNGNGQYIWANGDVYVGNWKMGARDGKGKFSYTKDEENKVDEGIWDNNIYLGEKLLPPKVIEKINIDSDYFFDRLSNGDKITISFTQNGNPIIPLDLYLIHTCGSEFKEGYNVGLINITFPFRCKIKFRSDNGIVKEDCILDFEIPQQGDWTLNINIKSNMLNKP